MRILAHDTFNQSQVDDIALAITKVELAAKDLLKRHADLVRAQIVFEDTCILPVGQFGYKSTDYDRYYIDPTTNTRAIDPETGAPTEWCWYRPTQETGVHPSQFQESRSVLGALAGKIGEVFESLANYHTEFVGDACNVRILPEGCGK